MNKSKTTFSPIKKSKRISERVEEKIKEAIFEQHYHVGDKIPSERELAEMFECSRLSVREALRSLERSGLLEIKKGVTGGAYVLKTDAEPVVRSLKDMLMLGQVSIEEIAEARLVIEPTLCALAAEKATPEDIARLEQINQTLKDLFDTGDPFRENDPRIHTVIAEISGNKVLAITVKALMEIHAARMREIKLNQRVKKDILHYHEEIIGALKAKNKELAFEYMKKHVLSVRDALISLEKEKKRRVES